MIENIVAQLAGRDAIDDPLMQLLCEGTRRLIERAVEAELQDLLARHANRGTEDGLVGVVRNGHLPARELQTGPGAVTVQIPKWRAWYRAGSRLERRKTEAGASNGWTRRAGCISGQDDIYSGLACRTNEAVQSGDHRR